MLAMPLNSFHAFAYVIINHITGFDAIPQRLFVLHIFKLRFGSVSTLFIYRLTQRRCVTFV
ncbi:hypothetical protein KPSA1_03520 [Pseudomonas syringae pv. actinidiae]|uniref:Uncharacterized protein n=1 Tax=Pseudomonas syringae pv. actinidiae TaxID=103796 RepID=A0A2V0QND2_PSESF|nr:hypothetical protein KPSA1_03520 [Pseudomonas syringae pv. actinidiae]